MYNNMVSSLAAESPYTKKLEAIRGQYPGMLDDFQKHYIMYQKNPEVAEFHNFFFESKSQLTTLKNTLETAQQSLEQRIQRMEAESRAASEKIDAEKDRYGRAFTAHARLANANEGAEQGISDAQHLYNLQYMKNFEMIVGLAGMLALLLKCAHK
jgi:chromosome segregation ATPase